MVSFNYSTVAQLVAALRDVFRDGSPEQRHRAARFIWNRNPTDAQLKAIFGVTTAQLPALKTKLQAMTDRINALEAEAGA